MRKCPNCQTLNGDAAKICINCQTALEKTKVNNAYTNYEIQRAKNARQEETAKKFEYWWLVIDLLITAIIILIAIAK